jgi:predicted secreted protein
MTRFALTTALLLLTGTAALAAAPAPTYDRIHLSVTEDEQVENDTAVAEVFAQAESHDIAAASDRVNRLIAAAIATAKQHRAIEVQTLEYRTTPVYQAGKATGQWRVQQGIRFESRDPQTLSNLLGELQKTVALRSLGYELSGEARAQVVERVTRRAIESFKARARLVAEAWGERHYRLVEMEITDNGASSPPLRMHTAEMAAARAAPPVEAGEQRVTVTVRGTIELQQ